MADTRNMFSRPPIKQRQDDTEGLRIDVSGSDDCSVTMVSTLQFSLQAHSQGEPKEAKDDLPKNAVNDVDTYELLLNSQVR